MTGLAKPLLAALVIAAIGAGVWQISVHRKAAIRPDTGEVVEHLSDSALQPVLTELLTRVYAAFGEEEEFAIYDGLATAVASDLLTELYLQRRAAQEQSYEDGGKVTIRGLEVTELTPLPGSGPDRRLQASWTVHGLISHDEHQHERYNVYNAQLTLGVAAGEWRLTGFDLDTIQRQEQEPIFFEDFE